MKIKIESGILHADGSPSELAEYTLALGLHRTEDRVDANAARLNQPAALPSPDPSLPDPGDLRRRVLDVHQSIVEDWVKTHPKDGVREFLSQQLGVPAMRRLTGPYRAVQVTCYNRLARTRRKLGIPAPTRAGGRL